MIELLLALAGEPATMDELARDPEVLQSIMAYKVCVRAQVEQRLPSESSADDISDAAHEACVAEFESAERLVTAKTPPAWKSAEVTDGFMRTLRVLEAANTAASVRKSREPGESK